MKKICVFDLNLNSILTCLFLLYNKPKLEIYLINNNKNKKYSNIQTSDINKIISNSSIDIIDFLYNTKSTFKVANLYKNNYYDIEDLENYVPADTKYEFEILKSYFYYKDFKNLNLLNKIFCKIIHLCDYNLFTSRLDTFSVYENVSYRLETSNTIEYIKKLCFSFNNFTFIEPDKKIKILQDADKNIESILLEDTEYKFDLYIDCSDDNFLIKNDNDYIDVSHIFNVNRLLNYKIEYKNKRKELVPYTKINDLDNGLVYNTCSYEYNNLNFLFNADIEFDNSEFIKNQNIIDITESTVNSGYYQFAWKNNILGLGPKLSYLDPIEGNEIFNLFNLLNYLSLLLNNDFITLFDKNNFNLYYKNSVEKKIYGIIKKRISFMHRNDTVFWKHYYTQDFFEKFEQYFNLFEVDMHQLIKPFNIKDAHIVYNKLNEFELFKNEMNKNFLNYYQWLKNNIFEKE